MAGLPLTVGTLTVAVVLGVGCAAAGAASARTAALAAAADAAALAAADAASGAVTGVPCERAAETAVRGGGVVRACEVTDLIATVTVGSRVGPFAVAVRARAGPPP